MTRKPYDAPAILQSFALVSEQAVTDFTLAMEADFLPRTEPMALCRCGHRRIEHSDTKRAVCRMLGCQCVGFDVVIG